MKNNFEIKEFIIRYIQRNIVQNSPKYPRLFLEFKKSPDFFGEELEDLLKDFSKKLIKKINE